ncbi:hypothetical protein [Nitrococcus mobilis]|uniref:Uncharacterized protein n=1 Tax=Nitrococcus mobilis Nb-231 TaxID=314278 RepID=A4BPS4_9GAMM|nr:hypothetical protein [Nitrococcus mobilis]EAR22079.1 hypothetical protein NB231_04200 [Nitrococcus mobilis Nb-231]
MNLRTFSGVFIWPLGENAYRLQLTAANHGYLPSYILASARRLHWNEPPFAELATSNGCALIDHHEWRQQVGHLDGWGGGFSAPPPWYPTLTAKAMRRNAT